MIDFPKNWDVYEFGEFAEINPRIQLKKGKKYSFIPMENLSTNFKYVTDTERKEFTGGGAKFENGDTLFARITPCLQNGKICKVNYLDSSKGFGSTEYFIFRGKRGVSDNDFVYYLSKTDWFQQNAINSMVGASGRQRADVGFVSKTELTLPNILAQQKISAILSSYDDLIENNLRRIKLLEEMAQITYENWFVRLKFPGHENAVIDPETGLPEGWKNKSLKEITTYINRGVAPKYVENDGFAVVNQKCIRGHSVNFYESRLTSHGHKIIIDKLLKPLDILVNSTGTGTLGRVAQIFDCPEKATVDTHVTIVRPSASISPYFLGRFLEAIEPFIVNLGKGATNQQELGRSDLSKIVKVNVPTFELMKDFDAIAAPTFDVISNLQNQNVNLKEAREILLPRLMTGMIDINDIELPELLLSKIENTKRIQTTKTSTAA